MTDRILTFLLDLSIAEIAVGMFATLIGIIVLCFFALAIRAFLDAMFR